MSRFIVDERFRSVRIAGPADFADGAVAASSRAVFTTVENDLQMQVVPSVLRKKPFQVGFRLLDVFSLSKAPPLR